MSKVRFVRRRYGVAIGSPNQLLHQGNRVRKYRGSWTAMWFVPDCGSETPLRGTSTNEKDIKYAARCGHCFDVKGVSKGATILQFRENTREEASA